MLFLMIIIAIRLGTMNITIVSLLIARVVRRRLVVLVLYIGLV